MTFQKSYVRVVEFLESRGADRIDAKTREDMDIQAKVREAIAKLDKERAPHGVDKVQWKRLRFNSTFDEAGETLRSVGRVEEAAQLDKMRGPLLEAMEKAAQSEGLDCRLVSRNAAESNGKHGRQPTIGGKRDCYEGC